MKNRSIIRGALFVAVCTAFVAAGVSPSWSAEHDHKGHDHKGHDHGKSHKVNKNPKYLFGNHECPATGEPVVPESYVEAKKEEEHLVGRIYTCCKGCNKKVKKQFAKLYKTLYRTDPKTGKEIPAKDLKNSTCPMSGDAVTDSSWIEYNGMIVHFCCDHCIEGFLEDPNTVLEKLVPNKKDYAYKRPAGSGSSK